MINLNFTGEISPIFLTVTLIVYLIIVELGNTKMRKRTFAQTLNGIFEDLKNAVYTKMHNEGKN